MAIDGQKDRLISVVQQRYGYPRERAQQEVDQRLQEYGERTAGLVATVTSAAQDVASSMAEKARTAATQGQEMAGEAGGSRPQKCCDPRSIWSPDPVVMS
jgi:hypothetical protein